MQQADNLSVGLEQTQQKTSPISLEQAELYRPSSDGSLGV